MSLKNRRTILFAGGGTGGHLFPAIAIADRLCELLESEQKPNIIFVGTKRGIEFRMRKFLGYPLKLINVRGLTRSLTVRNLLVPFLFIGALFRSLSILRELSPDIVIGTGGYVSLPVLKAAAYKRIPTILQEQNSYPGLATRNLSANAIKVFLGFEETKQFLPSSVVSEVVGNPVRRSVLGGSRIDAIREFKLDANKKTILILGGSQGARSINDAIIQSLEAGLPGENYQILWQTGKRDYTDVVASAGDRAHGHTLFPFATKMDTVYAAADFAIARAGAVTIAELEANMVPALLIPYPHAAGDHQRKNASAYVNQGGAELLAPEKLADTNLLKMTIDIIESEHGEKMKSRLRKLLDGKKAAVDLIAEDIITLISKNEEASVAS